MKKFTLLAMMLFAVSFVIAQEDETEGSTLEQPVRAPMEYPWEQVNIGDFAEPIAYPPVRQADVMYYWTVWRTIDLREKINHPLYFPSEPRGTWRSLGQTIFDAIDMSNAERTEGVLPVYSDEMCTFPYSRDELQGLISNVQTITKIDLETGEEIGEEELITQLEPKDIISYNVKEVWYFDKQYSTFRVQILMLQPIIEYEKQNNNNSYYDDENQDDEDVKGVMMKRKLGYIYYNELRPFLAKQEVFNVKNNASRISFDDLITWKRDFSSLIYKESNVYDRQIDDYIANSRDQRIESERITENLRKFESDLWEF
ncbi:MAG: gliding motility protein GldN [Bacteroidales bacterium]|jgi:gliding motility associated protien GldN|nr:gliding motility protein GldN [Bacteroidales bacterium]